MNTKRKEVFPFLKKRNKEKKEREGSLPTHTDTFVGKKTGRLERDLAFPLYSKKIKETKDGNFLLATGTYPPQIRCFEVQKNLELKFVRHGTHEVKDFKILSTNWEKLVFLREDKTLEFHTKQGSFYFLKIPEQASDLTLDTKKGIIYIPSLYRDIYTVDATEGRFSNSFKVRSTSMRTCSDIHPSNNILGFGYNSGRTEFWDPRAQSKPVGCLKNCTLKKKNLNPVSSLRFSENHNVSIFIGYDSGDIVLYDLRAQGPVLSKNLGNNLPITSIKNHFATNIAVTADLHTVSMWDINNGKEKGFVKSPHKINHVCQLRDKGFLFLSVENPLIQVKFIKKIRLPGIPG
jgi:ribosome biogenesis protein ENP2|mmetsp:Transcript_55808/g.132451  ORF Transcript_55808/g.132451 Transcript_55808/m.132451 type:complete len:347 (-) Transcript_55808:170-1210(-)